MKRPSSGFTLIEVLLATGLLAVGLALCFAAITHASRLVETSERVASSSEQLRGVQTFMRRQLMTAQPIAFDKDNVTRREVRFVGESNRVSFVADLPSHLGRGGAYAHTIYLDDQGRLVVNLQMVQLSSVDQHETEQMPETQGPEVLADGIAEISFRYRGLDKQGRLGEWEEQWSLTDYLPIQVEVDIRPHNGGNWPAQVITLARGNGRQADWNSSGEGS